MLRRLSLLTCLALLAGPLLAHSELPRAAWCEGGQPVEVASFRFEPAALSPRSGLATCPGPGDSGNMGKNCGQFDDDYRHASDASRRYCATFERVRRRGEIVDAGSVVVLVTRPASFLRPTHHADYAISQGLEGVCVRCESAVALPAVQISPRRSD